MRPSKYLAPLAQRFDAGESAVISRSLEHVETSMVEVVYAETRALRFVPLISGVDPGAKYYIWQLLDFVGEAKRGSDRGKDLPRVDGKLEEFSSPIESYVDAYGYTVQELREIALAKKHGVNLQLDQMRAKKAAEIIARKMDKVIAFGDPDDTRIKGFLNNGNVTTQTATGVWSGLTADNLLAELFALANATITTSKETLDVTSILLPTTQWLQVTKTTLGANADKSVLTYFLEAMRSAGRQMEVSSWPLLALANAALNGPRAVAYRRDPDVAGAVMPLAFNSEPPQADGFEWEIPCEGRCGGTVIKQPMGVVYRDGI